MIPLVLLALKAYLIKSDAGMPLIIYKYMLLLSDKASIHTGASYLHDDYPGM